MRHERPETAERPAIALASFMLVIPMGMFLTALFLRALQPIQHEPAATADAIARWFGGFSAPVRVAAFVACPVVAFVLAAADQWRRLAGDPAWRANLGDLAGAAERTLLRHPLAILSALALLASALILALLIGHAIIG